MGRAVIASTPAAAKPPPPEPQPEKIDLDDGHAIKHKLDQAASQVFCSASSKHVQASHTKYEAGMAASRPASCHAHTVLSAAGPAVLLGHCSSPAAVTTSCLRREHSNFSQLRCGAVQVILQSGYEEDHLISNVKIALGLTA